MIVELLDNWGQELMKRFPCRLTGKQKESFLAYIEQELQDRGYETEQVNIRHWGFFNRLMMTQCDKPKVIFMAHYDTPTIMPFGILPIYTLFGHTRQGLSSVFVFVLVITLFVFQSWLDVSGFEFGATAFFLLMGVLFLLPFFFPNPHNAEDNTSGVLSLLALADWLKNMPYKDAVQFVFLDNEEWGLIGSRTIKRIWQKQGHLDSNIAIINLDCVSRGQKPLIVHHKDDCLAQEISSFIQTHLPLVEVLDMKNMPLSDNYTFREIGAIDISFAEPSLIPGGYYIPKVHTPSDKDFSPENTARLIAGLSDYLHDKLSNDRLVNLGDAQNNH